ncbi:hypothetical protein RRG08_022427 [Elysia crispata]|uniref:Uncharacterized protein n=1 Tax=Elysia crispata TaxID=231223 RepID=A0AAE0Z2N6_9GAST|nr:hypothetical protein RRG08_022427 [Elysia crispata]
MNSRCMALHLVRALHSVSQDSSESQFTVSVGSSMATLHDETVNSWGAQSWIYRDLVELLSQSEWATSMSGIFLKNKNLAQVHHCKAGGVYLLDGWCQVRAFFEFCSQTSSCDEDRRPASESMIKLQLYSYEVVHTKSAVPQVIVRVEEWERLVQTPMWTMDDVLDINSIEILQRHLTAHRFPESKEYGLDNAPHGEDSGSNLSSLLDQMTPDQQLNLSSNSTGVTPATDLSRQPGVKLRDLVISDSQMLVLDKLPNWKTTSEAQTSKSDKADMSLPGNSELVSPDQNLSDSKFRNSGSLFSDTDKELHSTSSRSSAESVTAKKVLQTELACVGERPQDVQVDNFQAVDVSSDEDIYILNPLGKMKIKNHFIDILATVEAELNDQDKRSVSSGDSWDQTQWDYDTNRVTSSTSDSIQDYAGTQAVDPNSSFTCLKTFDQTENIENHVPGKTKAGANSHLPLESEVSSSCTPCADEDHSHIKSCSIAFSLEAESVKHRVELPRTKDITYPERHIHSQNKKSFEGNMSLDLHGVPGDKGQQYKGERKSMSCAKSGQQDLHGGGARTSSTSCKHSVEIKEIDNQNPHVANILACPKGSLIFPDLVEPKRSSIIKNSISCNNKSRTRARRKIKFVSCECKVKTSKKLFHGTERNATSSLTKSSDNSSEKSSSQSSNEAIYHHMRIENLPDRRYEEHGDFHSSPEAPGISVQPCNPRIPTLHGAAEHTLSCSLSCCRHENCWYKHRRGKSLSITCIEKHQSEESQALFLSSTSNEIQSLQPGQLNQSQSRCMPTLPAESQGFEYTSAQTQPLELSSSEPQVLESQGFQPHSCHIDVETDQDLELKDTKTSSSNIGSVDLTVTAPARTQDGISRVLHFIHYGDY